MSSAQCEDPLLRRPSTHPWSTHSLYRARNGEVIPYPLPRGPFPRPKTNAMLPKEEGRWDRRTQEKERPRRALRSEFNSLIQNAFFFLRYICISLLLFKNKYVLRNISENCTRDKDVMLISFSPTIITDKQ